MQCFERKFLLSKFLPLVAAMIWLVPLTLGGGGCGGTGTGNPPGNVLLQSAPLAGPNAASIDHPGFWITELIERFLLGISPAYAAVSNFTLFKLCNDTFVMTDVNGGTVTINGTASGAGLGLLNFSPTATNPMGLTSLNIVAGTQIKEIDITTAVKPEICGGVNYAVLFDPGSGNIPITQNTAFKFKFATPVTITGSSQLFSLLFGQIVNGMVSLGTGLNNSTIQTVNVGQAN